MLFKKVNLFIKVFLTLVLVFSSNFAFSNFSDFEKAKDLIKSGEISEGIKSLKLSANHDPKSAHLLGLIYLNGKLLPLNKDIAFQLFFRFRCENIDGEQLHWCARFVFPIVLDTIFLDDNISGSAREWLLKIISNLDDFT